MAYRKTRKYGNSLRAKRNHLEGGKRGAGRGEYWQGLHQKIAGKAGIANWTSICIFPAKRSFRDYYR